MKRFSLVAISLIVLAAISALAAPNPSTAKVPAFPGILANARYVYVASYDGDQFDPNLLPEDREAIDAVQNAIQEWGKLTIVYQPSEADIIILVTSRPSEDVMAVYDAPGRVAVFSGASWDATVSSPAKLRWSRNLNRDSRACRSTSKLARACCAGRQRPNVEENSAGRRSKADPTISLTLWRCQSFSMAVSQPGQLQAPPTSAALLRRAAWPPQRSLETSGRREGA